MLDTSQKRETLSQSREGFRKSKNRLCTPDTWVTYRDCESILECSPRSVRTHLQRFAELCPIKKIGYRTIRFPLLGVLAVRQKLIEERIARGIREGAHCE
jgi:hypothetical protein